MTVKVDYELLELLTGTTAKVKKEWLREISHVATPTQYFILKTLERTGPHKAKELAELVQMTPGAVSGASNKLVAGGYIERRGADDDRRVVYLAITDKGKQFLSVIAARQKEVIEKLLQGLSQEDIDHLIRIYKLLALNLGSRY